MICLGLKTSGHDTAATIVKDGQIIAACAQERFDRKKHSKEFPKDAIDFCLKQAGISIKKVDIVVIPFNYPFALTMLVGKFTLEYFPASVNATRTLFPYLFSKWRDGELRLRKMGYLGKIKYVEHHLGHAASAFYPSNLDSTAVLTIDARGESPSTCVYLGKSENLKRTATLANYPHSLGYLYTSLTAYLGFERNSGEGKVMGLAPYGDWSDYKQYTDVLKLLPDGKFKLDLSYFSFHLGAGLDVSEKFEKTFGPRRIPNSEITTRHKNIAAFLQHITEEAVLHCAKYAMESTGERSLCLSGGVALNSVANGKIQKTLVPEQLFIQPASTDDGSALGAALFASYSEHFQNRVHINDTVYLGPEYSDKKIALCLEKNRLKYKKSESVEKIVAREIVEGKIVAWFQGRSEFGPRALGNRSILVDPRDPTMKDKLNSKVKFRESFRPFAPSVLEESASEYFDCEKPSPYMLLTYNVKKKYQKEIPAVTHIDGTARIQTVSKKQNLRYWKLLNEFGKITGIPILLNTSFNIKGEPIVNTPQEAVDSFLNSGIDVLAIGSYIVKKDFLYTTL
ncbi:MAG: carbamoyltransferase [Patescibacteria group bacterium]